MRRKKSKKYKTKTAKRSYGELNLEFWGVTTTCVPEIYQLNY